MKANPEEFVFEPLNDKHDRAAFCCEKKDLEAYFRTRAGQDVKRNLAAVFVVFKKTVPAKIVGFYSLSNKELSLNKLPPEAVKKLGKYPNIPVTLLGRMAVDDKFRAQGIGELILLHALEKSFNSTKTICSYAVFVEAKDEKTAGFYVRYGFIRLPEDKLKLYLPMKTIGILFEQK